MVGGKLANAGLRVVVETSADGALDLVGSRGHEGKIVGICTDTRNAAPEVARAGVERAAAALAALGRRRVFKFVDSSLRGQVGVELAAVADTLGARDGLVVPGTPSAGRSVSGGVVLIEGRPARLSPLLENEVLARLSSSRVESLFSVPGVAVARSVPVEEWREDAFWVTAGLRPAAADGPEALSVQVLDAPDAAAFQTVRRLLEATPRGRRLDLLCGAVGLAEVWAGLLARKPGGGITAPSECAGSETRDREYTHGLPVLVVNGSASPAALQQVDYLARRGVGLTGWPAEVGETSVVTAQSVEVLLANLRESGSAAFTVPSPTTGRVDVATARRLPGQIAEVVRQLLTSLAVEGGRCGLVLVGGMTAAAVLDRTGVSRLVPLCEAGFVTLCRIEPTTGPIGFVALKGGASGDEAVLERVVRRL
ncbi:MAG: hypothetical protein M9914_13775 [Trueperaceae bacterium]|nr:hypothetical protein [Trueperaceae bacterium]MCW5818306.1 hypothetical protein [Trueperaceae bacterium]